MKKLYCEPKIFDLYQSIYLINSEDNSSYCVQIVTLEDFPKVMNELCYKLKIFNITLAGSRTYNKELSNEILKYNNLHYNENKLEIEVI